MSQIGPKVLTESENEAMNSSWLCVELFTVAMLCMML